MGDAAGAGSVGSSAESLVQFERAVNTLPSRAVEAATAAKYRLEHFYKGVVSECADREGR